MTTLQNRIHLTNQVLKAIKKSLPKSCSYLSLYKRRSGETCLKATVKKNDYYYSLPQDFVLTEASFERIRSLILENCKTE